MKLGSSSLRLSGNKLSPLCKLLPHDNKVMLFTIFLTALLLFVAQKNNMQTSVLIGMKNI